MSRIRSRVWPGLAAVLWLAAAAGCGSTTMPAVHSEPERLDLARKAMARHDYSVAVELLKSYVSNNGGSRDVDEAIYRLGMSYMGMKEFPSAQVEFERLVRDYPESDSCPSAAFRLGEALMAQTRPRDFDQEYTHKAVDQWKDYLASYNGHWLNPEARRRVAEAEQTLAGKLGDAGRLYLKMKLPGPARVYFNRIIEEYPDTWEVGWAKLGLAICDGQQGRIPEAIEQLKHIEAEYPRTELARQATNLRSRLQHQSS
jgi:outer membrane protein assembly factor BamD